MAFDRFMIAPIAGGLQKDVKPWLISNDAFEQLNNAYIFRGRVRKRFGSSLMNQGVAVEVAQLSSRLRIALTGGAAVGITDGAGNATGTVPGILFKVGQLFSIGTQIFTVSVTGAPGAMLNTGIGTGTYNTTTGVYVFAGATPLTQIYFYPAEPVMGLIQYEDGTSLADPTYAFDTQFSYQFTSGAWARLGTAVWTGSNSQFFWGCNWRGIATTDRLLYVTNNNSADGIKYWNGAVWAVLNPLIDSGGVNRLITANMIVVYKNRLVVLSPTETTGTYTNRARYSQDGDPLDALAWRGDIPGRGNSIDADTHENIVSCCFVKDRLIVFFERSTWTLVYTENPAQPFTWQRINIELGADSTFSAVPFDQVALAIGNVGIHQCNGQNVDRIDDKIPDDVWNIHAGTNSVARVHGIRDYFAEQVYWTFPNLDTNSFNSTFPNKILVYNYVAGTWAFNTDSITTWGYFYAASQSAINWDSQQTTWDDTDVTWDSGVGQPLNQDIIAGNQEGFVFVCSSDDSSNAAALQITNIVNSSGNVLVTAINHNLDVSTHGSTQDDQSQEGDYVYLQFLNGLTGPFSGIYPVISVVSADQVIILAPDILAALQLGQTYTGGGTIARVSRIDIITKQFNFYVNKDRNAYIQKVDFLVDRTDEGAITVDYFLGSSSEGNLSESITNGSIVGTGILETTPYTLYPLEAKQDRLWHPVYLQGDSNAIQLRIYLNNDQLSNFNIATEGFEIHAMCIYATPTGSRLQ